MFFINQIKFVQFKKKVVFGFFLIFLLISASNAFQNIQAENQINQLISDNQGFWGISFQDAETGENLIQINSTKRLMPASNLKLLTSAAILQELGPDFYYETKIYGDGELNSEKIWKGNLYIVGAGDPSIDGKFTAGNRFYAFENLSSQLSIKGLEGNIIANDSYFDAQSLPLGWSWDDLSYYYAPEISALSFNGNCIELEVSTKDGKPQINWFPFNTDFVSFINLQTSGASEFKEFYRRLPGTNLIMLKSQLPKNYIERESLTITLPSLYFIDSFAKYLQTKNITFQGELLLDHQNKDWNNYRLLANHRSPPLAELIEEVNKHSNNFYTEMLLKTAAAHKYQMQASTELGLELVKDFAANMGFDRQKLVLSDGSGLAYKNLVSTVEMTNFLTQMRKQNYFETFENSLSIAGIDGSLESRFADSVLKNKIKGKSGYISGTRALSGYLQTSKGRLLSFSIIANHYTESNRQIDALQKKALEIVYENF